LSAPHEETKTELVIDRKRWLRGEGGAVSKLLRPSDGKMCCLGFYGRALGFSPDEIGHLSSPSDTYASGRWPAWLLQYVYERGCHSDTETCNQLIRTNDDAPTAPDEREAKIAAIFARHGVTVRFVDEPEAQP
jgi:hypothetical protein